MITRPFPAFFLQPEFMGSGCQAKLAMFDPGVVPDDLPAVYVDLDTLVLRDLRQMLRLLDRPDRLAILQSAILPFGRLATLLWRVTKGRRYARGNSSIVVWHPAHGTDIAAKFRELVERHGKGGIRPMIADERFMSWAAQPRMRAVPISMAVKFPTEYMQPWRWLVLLRARLPWIRRRRAGLIAVTLPGVKVKGAELLALREGAEIVDRKGRRLIWSARALGPLKDEIVDHYRKLGGALGA